MQPLVVLGARNFAPEIADLVRDVGSYDITAFVENYDRDRCGGEIDGVAIVWVDDIAPLAATDWLARVAESFTPQRIGRSWVHGSHLRAAAPAGAVAIQLDPGLAFGSGEHESTRGCLLALDALAGRRRFRRVLDLGCGSGILAIAAAKCWPAAVLAVDNDPDAVAVAAANARNNGVADRVATAPSEGYRGRKVRARGPYDLVLANILADPLCAMARDLARHLAPGGSAILSGLLDRQAPRVVETHRAVGLRLRARLDLGIWTTLVLAKRRRVTDNIG